MKKHFSKKIASILAFCGIEQVLTRIDNDCVSFVFFFEDFAVFNAIYKHIKYDFSIDLFRVDNMACIKIYTAGMEEHLLGISVLSDNE